MIALAVRLVRKVQAAESRVPSVSLGQAQGVTLEFGQSSHRNYVDSFTLKVEGNE
jgi:hypothetical protein